MKIEKYMCAGSELGIEVKLAHRGGGLVDTHLIRLHIKGGCITLRVAFDGTLDAHSDNGTLGITPRASNAINMRIQR